MLIHTIDRHYVSPGSWVDCTEGKISSNNPHQMVGGNGEQIYVCRAVFNGDTIPGKVR